jgi:hypothetical protein
LSFPIGVWQGLLYRNAKEIKIDAYYNSTVHPTLIHDTFGAGELDKFTLAVINEILERNSTDKIWRMHADAFAILHKDSNCGSFNLNYRGLEHVILKKTIEIKVVDE